jgi:hypothetical protein
MWTPGLSGIYRFLEFPPRRAIRHHREQSGAFFWDHWIGACVISGTIARLEAGCAQRTSAMRERPLTGEAKGGSESFSAEGDRQPSGCTRPQAVKRARHGISSKPAVRQGAHFVI